MRTRAKMTAPVAAAALLLGPTLVTAPAVAAEYNWTFQSSAQTGDPFFPIQQDWARAIEEESGGRIAIELLPAGAVVQYNETLEAAGTGILTGHLTDPSYFAGKDPAFAVIGNLVAAWEHPFQMREFLEEGGGYEIYRKLLEQYNLHLIGAAWTGVEAFVSKVPIRGVDDLRGVKVRAPEGLVQEVFAAAGATPVNLPASEVYTSLERGVVDAADYSVLSANQALGFHQFAQYPVYPGFHSMPVVEVAMNLDEWNALPDDLKEIVTNETRALSTDMVERLEELDQKAVEEAKAQGAEVIDWPEVERIRFRQVAQEQWQKWAERSPIAQEWYETVTAWRATGCGACEHQGYQGRFALMEVLRMDAELDDLIARRSTQKVIAEAAYAKGFRTLASDGVRWVREGLTSLEEVARVIDLTSRV
jgi:TRAP-type mannitol/chloroaromatic compound transport system substrate-binding protein